MHIKNDDHFAAPSNLTLYASGSTVPSILIIDAIIDVNDVAHF